MKLYEVCIEQDYAEPTTVAIAISKENAYKEKQEWIEQYGNNEVFIQETETID